MADLILTLRERELSRFSIVAVRTTIGRDPGCDVVIDNAGISRLHAAVEVVGDSFVLRDCESQNGITLNGEPCREGRLVDGDVIGVNKFLLRFSNQALEVPANLQRESQKPQASRPKDVQRTMHLDADDAHTFAERAKEQIARQRAESAGASLPPLESSPTPRAPESLGWEEPTGLSASLPLLVGGVVALGALIAGLLWIAL